jgi:hypothetical protein
MTPKEKAIELVNNFSNVPLLDSYEAKQCALIAVNMVIKCCEDYDELNETYVTQVDHWTEVKREIEKL